MSKLIFIVVNLFKMWNPVLQNRKSRSMNIDLPLVIKEDSILVLFSCDPELYECMVTKSHVLLLEYIDKNQKERIVFSLFLYI